MRETNRQRSAQVSRYLHGMNFPADRNAVIRHARGRQVDDDTLDMLSNIANRDYGSVADVRKGLNERP